MSLTSNGWLIVIFLFIGCKSIDDTSEFLLVLKGSELSSLLYSKGFSFGFLNSEGVKKLSILNFGTAAKLILFIFNGF